MSSKWISVSEALAKTGKSEITIRRYVSEHKDDSSIIKKQSGKVLINTEYLYQIYQPINDISNDRTHEENKNKKEAMQIAYNSEIIRKKDEYLQVKDRQLELLINKKSYAPLWVALSFVILIVALGYIAYLYRAELLNNQKNRVTELKHQYSKMEASYQKIISIQKKQIAEQTKSWW